jgi:ubiquinone/menaquinone biosynthesis C-methylase UbiE
MHAEKWDTFVKSDLIERIKKDIIPLFKIKKGDIILDVGCGTGILLPFLKTKTGKSGEITALDYSQKMIDKAKEKHGDNFKYVCTSAEKTKFKKDAFDKVICFSVFPHFPNKLKVLKELFRVLSPEGILIIAHADVRETINSFHHQVGGPVGCDHMPDDKSMTALMEKAGFEQNTIKEGKDYYIAYGYK